MAADGSSRAWARRWETAGRASARLVPRSSSRAISAARSASWRRSWASRVRTRARSASVLATSAAMKKTPSATQFSPSEIVKRPVGGMWKKLKASALARAVAAPSQPPQKDETSSTATR